MSEVDSKSHGKIETWIEVEKWGTTDDFTLWGASADVHGREQRRYGKTQKAAVLSLLESLESGPVLPAPAGEPEESGTAGARVAHYGDRADLPQEFWYYLDHGLKIQAIKRLREVSGLTLRGAKEIVDRIAPLSPARHTSPFRMSAQPAGTVLRIGDGTLDWVVEKAGVDAWEAMGSEETCTDAYVQAKADLHDYEILHLPKEAK